jgi:DNA segregation ATPase FtsK/SpoIIIE-like protein
LLAVGFFIRLRSHNLLAALGASFYSLFGWGTILLDIGLVALAVANLAEAATRKPLIRPVVIIQVTMLGCLLMAESRLLLGGDTGQLFGRLLVAPLADIPPLAQQIGVSGGIMILLWLLFRISFGQVLWLLRSLAHRLFGALASAIKQAHARAPIRTATAQASNPLVEEEGGEEDNPAFDGADDEEEDGIPAQEDRATSETADSTLEELPPLPAPTKARARGDAAPGTTSEALAPGKVVAAGRYKLPPISLLNNAVEQRKLNQDKLIEALARKVERTLRSFRVDAEVRRADISVGPTVIRVGVRPVEKVKKDYRGHVVLDDEGEPVLVRTRVSRIMALQNDLALDLEAKSIRMEAPVPGRPYVGVEIPNKQSRLVTLREILAGKDYEESRRKSRLTVALGRDVAGRARIGDLARFPHLLIAGTTGAGKSVCINSIIACLLMQATPEDVRFLMVDPKMVELTGFNGIPHLLAPVVTDVEQVIGTLKRGIKEMERRYRLFSKIGVRNLEAYRKVCAQRPELEPLPNIVIIIDELADLMMAAPEEVESLICRLAQLARATGIHLVVATQRPSVDVITGLIKANFPTRISFMVSSSIDSRTILDMGGAERLLGRGDMLYMPIDAGKPERIQGTYLSDDELERIVEHWRQAPQIPSTQK